jgi:hypothetical protein
MLDMSESMGCKIEIEAAKFDPDPNCVLHVCRELQNGVERERFCRLPPPGAGRGSDNEAQIIEIQKALYTT